MMGNSDSVWKLCDISWYTKYQYFYNIIIFCFWVLHWGLTLLHKVDTIFGTSFLTTSYMKKLDLSEVK